MLLYKITLNINTFVYNLKTCSRMLCGNGIISIIITSYATKKNLIYTIQIKLLCITDARGNKIC